MQAVHMYKNRLGGESTVAGRIHLLRTSSPQKLSAPPNYPAVSYDKQVQRKFKALAKLVSSGANQFLEGVSNITALAETSARVHMTDNDDEPMSFRRIASGSLWSASRRRLDSGASVRQSSSMRAPGPRGAGGEPGGVSETKIPMSDILDEEVSSVEPMAGKAQDTRRL